MKTFNKTFLISISFLFAGTCHSVKADEHIDETSNSAILTGTSESKTLLEKAEEKMMQLYEKKSDILSLCSDQLTAIHKIARSPFHARLQ